jgi:hypothetical protein
MHDATLDQGIRIDAFDGILEACQPVDAEEQDVLYATSLDVLQYQTPLPRTLAVVQIETQNVALAIHRDAIDRVNRLADDFAVFPNLIMDRIKINDRETRCQRALLPLKDLVPYAVGDGADGTHAHFHAIQFHELVADVLYGLTTRVKAQYNIIKAGAKLTLPLLDQLGLVAPIAVPGRVYG